MRIELLKDTKHGINNWVKGAIANVSNDLGNKLVRDKKAKVWDDNTITREPEPKKKETKDEAIK